MGMRIGSIQKSNTLQILNDIEDDSSAQLNLSTVSIVSEQGEPFLSSTELRTELPTDKDIGSKIPRAVVIGFFVAIAGLLDSISFLLEPCRVVHVSSFLIG